MLDRLVELEAELEALEATLADVYASGDQAAARDAGRRHNDLRDSSMRLGPGDRPSSRTRRGQRELAGAEQDPDQKEQWRTEQESGEARVAELEERVRELLIPKDPNDGRNVIVEIRGAKGATKRTSGPAICTGCTSVLRRDTPLEETATLGSTVGHGRIPRSHVRGQGQGCVVAAQARSRPAPGAAGAGDREPGARAHQRGDRGGLPEAEEVDVAIDPNDLEIDVYRSTGPAVSP